MPVCEKRVDVVLGPNDYVILINLKVNGREYGQVPIVYQIPVDLAEDERAEFARTRITEIMKLLNEQGQKLVDELDSILPGNHMELRLAANNELEWLGTAPDTPEELT